MTYKTATVERKAHIASSASVWLRARLRNGSPGHGFHVSPVSLIRLKTGSADVPAGAGGLHLFTVNGRLGVSGV